MRNVRRESLIKYYVFGSWYPKPKAMSLFSPKYFKLY